MSQDPSNNHHQQKPQGRGLLYAGIALIVGVAFALAACNGVFSPDRASNTRLPVPPPTPAAVVAPATTAAAPATPAVPEVTPAATVAPRQHCTMGAEVFSRNEDAATIRIREAFEDYLADKFCQMPETHPDFHQRPREITWTFGDSVPVIGEVDTTAGRMRWEPIQPR